MNEGKEMLQLVGVSMEYGSTPEKVRVLDAVDFSLERGERIVLMGPSGCGKTTLLHILGGLLKPTAGEVRWEGVPIDFRKKGMERRRGQLLGFIFQRPLLFPELNVEENVAFPGRILGPGEGLFRARELLDWVGLVHRRRAMPWELSGGEQQRVAIARALMGSPKFLLADEPTGSLDNVTGERVKELLLTLSQNHRIGLLLVTHNPGLAPIGDRIVQIVGENLEETREKI
jgi:ABC-type lipoprotein export system ATPase subunit